MESPAEFLLFASIAAFNLLFLQIKAILRRRGYDVTNFLDWGKDFYRFRELIERETDGSEKRRLKNVLFGLYASIIGMILAPVLGILLA